MAEIKAFNSGKDTGKDIRPHIAAQSVLKLEAEALSLLGQSLGEIFDRAIERLEKVSGRVVVSGIGKSGHIARKIAATLASTGTPAFFVHPTEASHGDLGMITREDAIIALSNSGETSELADILAYAKRHGIPLIAITSRAESALGQAGDITLLLPNLPEAGSMGLAPTTSTTMMLALGDAIAVALLERKGFTAEDFRNFHPGGKLGQRLLKVASLMHRGEEMPLVPDHALMDEAIIVMTAKTFGCVGVVDAKGDLVGIITDGDLRRHMGTRLLTLSVRDVMTQGPVTVREKALASEALHIMEQKSISCLFVLEQKRPVGIIRLHDCLKAGVG